MESQPQNPEFTNNPEKVHPCFHFSKGLRTCSPPPLPSLTQGSSLKFSLPPLNLVSIHNSAAYVLICNYRYVHRST